MADVPFMSFGDPFEVLLLPVLVNMVLNVHKNQQLPVDDDDDDELMLNVLRCHLTY